MSAMRGDGGSLSDMRGGGREVVCACVIGLGCGGTLVMGAVVSSCGTCVHRVGLRCGGILVENTVSSCGVRLVFVGKLACSHICCLGVVGIESLVLEHYFSKLFSLFSP